MIAKIDIAVRQVLIESRIVIADDSFGRSLGIRLGAADLRGVRGGLPGYSVGGDTRVTVGGNLNAVQSQTLQNGSDRRHRHRHQLRQPAGDRTEWLRSRYLRAVACSVPRPTGS